MILVLQPICTKAEPGSKGKTVYVFILEIDFTFLQAEVGL